MTDADPLASALSASEHTLEQPAEVGGVMCEVVAVREGEDRSKWWIGQKDGLPRQFERVLTGGGPGDAEQFTITEIALNEPINEAVFTIPVPEGYTRVQGVTPGAPRPAVKAPAEGKGEQPTRPSLFKGQKMPEFDLKNHEGKSVKLSDFKGKVVVLMFGGTWSKLIREAAPEFEKLQKEYKDKGVECLWLSMREKEEEAAQFWVDGKYTFTMLVNADEPAKQYRVGSYPGWVVVGREGEQVHQMKGYRADETFKVLRQQIEDYLGAQAEGAAGNK
jgi:peroxiredoxin